MKLIICILLSALFAVSLVSAIQFKNAILLDEGFNTFSFYNSSCNTLNSFNISLVNDTNNADNLNFFGYSSDSSTNVEDIIFYKEDGTSDTYQNAKDNGWIISINESIDSTINTVSGSEINVLEKSKGYWIRSFLAVNMTIPNVIGCELSFPYPHDSMIFFNGTNYLNIIDAETIGWVDNPLIWEPTNRGSADFEFVTSGNLFTWTGYIIFSFKPNIYLLFENKTIPPPQGCIVQLRKAKDTIAEKEGMIQQLKRDKEAIKNGIRGIIVQLRKLLRI